MNFLKRNWWIFIILTAFKVVIDPPTPLLLRQSWDFLAYWIKYNVDDETLDSEAFCATGFRDYMVQFFLVASMSTLNTDIAFHAELLGINVIIF